VPRKMPECTTNARNDFIVATEFFFFIKRETSIKPLKNGKE
jgi:hypothetical protein